MDAVMPILGVMRSDEGLALFAGGMILLWVVFILGMMALTAVIWWKIFAKAGHPGALGLLMFVPIANLVMLLVLAFGEWPIHRELAHYRAAAGVGPDGRPGDYR